MSDSVKEALVLSDVDIAKILYGTHQVQPMPAWEYISDEHKAYWVEKAASVRFWVEALSTAAADAEWRGVVEKLVATLEGILPQGGMHYGHVRQALAQAAQLMGRKQ